MEPNNQNLELQTADENVQVSGQHTTDEDSNRGKKKGKRSNWRAKQENRGFKLIDKRFKQRQEIMPGVISQSLPISGEIEINLGFRAERFYKAMRQALEKWSLSVGYQELRSLKGLNGLGASKSDSECVIYTAKILTLCAFRMISAPCEYKNFGVHLMNLGLGKLILPTLFMDLLKLSVSYNKIHQPTFLEASTINFKVKEFNRIAADWKSFNEEFEACSKFGDWDVDFMTVYNYLSRFTQLTNIMGTSETDCFQLVVDSSPYIFNAYTYDSSNGAVEILVGRNVVTKDVMLELMLEVTIVEMELQDYHIDGFIYTIPSQKLITSLKRAMLLEYFGIDDAFISPSTTAMSGSVMKAVSEGVTSI